MLSVDSRVPLLLRTMLEFDQTPPLTRNAPSEPFVLNVNPASPPEPRVRTALPGLFAFVIGTAEPCAPVASSGAHVTYADVGPCPLDVAAGYRFDRREPVDSAAVAVVAEASRAGGVVESPAGGLGVSSVVAGPQVVDGDLRGPVGGVRRACHLPQCDRRAQRTVSSRQHGADDQCNRGDDDDRDDQNRPVVIAQPVRVSRLSPFSRERRGVRVGVVPGAVVNLEHELHESGHLPAPIGARSAPTGLHASKCRRGQEAVGDPDRRRLAAAPDPEQLVDPTGRSRKRR